jgi:hypothetical protein
MLPHKNLWIRRYMDDLQYSDSDDDKVEPVPEEIIDRREANKNDFRAKILEWKRKQIDNVTRESQDTTVLNKYLRDSADLYKTIKDKLEGRTEIVGGGGIDFNLNVSSGMERANLLSAAYSDLVEFPFTYSKNLINSFPKTNSLEHAEIIPNQE